MKKRNLLIFTNIIIGSVLLGGGLQVFQTIKNHQQELNNKAENLFDKAFPNDFFGEYSYAKFWEQTTTHEIVWEDPDSKDYLCHYASSGNGQQTFYTFTMAFNKASILGYEGKYYDEYEDFILNGGPSTGFYGLDPYLTLLDLSYYIEDWIVWNVNEMQGYDMDVGHQIKNDEISLAWNEKTIADNANELDKILLKDYQSFASEISIGNKTSSLGYVYQFTYQPLNNEAVYDSKKNNWVYQIYPLERLIFDDTSDKINVNNKISQDESHLAFKEYNYQSLEEFESNRFNTNQYYMAQKNKLSGFEFLANQLIYQWLNRKSPLVIQYGWDYVRANDAILANQLQTYQKGFVAKKDYEVLYEISSDQNNWKEANTYGDFHHINIETGGWEIEPDPLNLKLDGIDYLRVTIKFEETYRTEASKVSETFRPKFEWGIINNPDENDNKKLWLIVPLVLIIVTIIFSIVGFFIKKLTKKSRS